MATTPEKKPRKSRAQATKPKVATIIAHKEYKDGDPVPEDDGSQFACPETHPHLFDEFGNRI